MTTTSHAAAESGIALLAKAAPPVSVSLATVAGYQVSEIVMWMTMIYTALMLGHKLVAIYRDIMGKNQ